MLKNQNSIELNSFKSRYDEVIVRSSDTAVVLAGALVNFKEHDSSYYTYKRDGATLTRPDVCPTCYNEGIATRQYKVPEEQTTDSITVLYKNTIFEQVKHNTTTSIVEKSYTDSYNIASFTPAVIIEDSLYARSINHINYAGKVARCRKLFPGDKFLIRAVAGSYTIGDPLFAVETANGIYVTKQSGGMFIGWAAESYNITAAMVDVVDTYQFPFPGSNNVAGKLVNLLAVTIGKQNEILIPTISNVTFAVKSTITPYDGEAHSLSSYFDMTGITATDTVTFTLTGTDTITVTDAGTYSVTATVKRAGHNDYTQTLSLTIPKKQLVVTGTTVSSRVANGSTNIAGNTTVGTLNANNLTVSLAGAILDNAKSGNRTATISYDISGTGLGNYILPSDDQIPVVITPALNITNYNGVYDGSAHTVEISGLQDGDLLTYNVNGSTSSEIVSDGAAVICPTFTDAGTYNIEILLSRDEVEIDICTCQVVVEKAARTGLVLSDYSGDADGVGHTVSLSGTKADDTVVYSYNDTEYATAPTFTAPGTYVVTATVSNPNYNDWSDSAAVELAVGNTYTLSTNATGTTTEVTATFTNSLAAPVTSDMVTISGDAAINGNPTVSDNVMTIPVKMTKLEGAASYTINVAIAAGNSDTETKQVAGQLVTGYWGCYPCQLAGSTTPTADQIKLCSTGDTLTGTMPETLTCAFALSETDWNNEVSANDVTGEDAEYGCGYEYVLYTWNASISSIVNALNISQVTAFNTFSIVIDNVQYTGIVSKSCSLPSGMSSYVVSFETN